MKARRPFLTCDNDTSGLRKMHRHEISESNGACNTHFIFDAVGKKKTSSTVLLRKAAKPSSLPRRSFPQPSSGHGPRVDPRPVSNKAFLNSCARQLMSYLTSHGYDVALSPKTLAAPSTKEFASLALFLFRRADENFKFGSKTEDDVPTFFRQLRYPFQISKCTLFAVGSLHTWPFLLSALTWLVQVYFYEEETKVPKVFKVACRICNLALLDSRVMISAGNTRFARRAFQEMREQCLSSKLC